MRPTVFVLVALAICLFSSGGVPARLVLSSPPPQQGGRTSAQSNQTGCPQLVIACPMEFVEQGQPTHFTALVAGGDRNAALTYSWTITGGRISQGQGTASIAIDTSGQGGRHIKVMVEVGGMSPVCQKRASCDITIIGAATARPPEQSTAGPGAAAAVAEPQRTARTEVAKPDEPKPEPAQPASSRSAERVGPQPSGTTAKPAVKSTAPETRTAAASTPSGAAKLDRYSELSFEEEKTHLSQLAARLRREPEAQGYIIVYGGRCSSNTEAQARGERAKEWIINRHGIDASRLVSIDGGFRETLSTELFAGPLDAALPELTAAREPLDRSRCK